MEDKKFRSALFGFNKDDVHIYLGEYAQKSEIKIDGLERRVLELVTANNALNEEKAQMQGRLNELTTKLEALEKDRRYISEAIIKAEMQAQEVIETAHSAAEGLSAQFGGEMRTKKEQLGSMRSDIERLKENVTTVFERNVYLMNESIRELDQLMDKYSPSAAHAVREERREQDENSTVTMYDIRKPQYKDSVM